MRTICALAVAAFVLAAVPLTAGAATVPVSIAKTGYTPKAVTATTADTVAFKNDDTVAHQVAFKPTTGVTCSPSPFTLAAGQSGTCTFTAAGAYTFSDPTVTGTTFQGTLTVTAPPVPDTLSLFADPQEVVFSSKVNLTGELSSKKAGVDVAVMATPCGKSTATKAATVQTTAGGEFSDRPADAAEHRLHRAGRHHRSAARSKSRWSRGCGSAAWRRIATRCACSPHRASPASSRRSSASRATAGSP